MKKNNAQPQAKAQPKNKEDILTIYDLDTVLKIAAEGKRQIERGEFLTAEELEIVMQKRIEASLSQ